MALILKPPYARRPFKLMMVLGALTLLTQAAALGEDVPFTAGLASDDNRDGSPTERLSLADIMSTMQLRYIRLWDAGNARNWDLVDYETDRVVASLKDAALVYLNMPLPDVMAMRQPMLDLHNAARTQGMDKFVQAYSRLTSVCNQCHVAGHVGFIHVQLPALPLHLSDSILSTWTGGREAISQQ